MKTLGFEEFSLGYDSKKYLQEKGFQAPSLNINPTLLDEQYFKIDQTQLVNGIVKMQNSKPTEIFLDYSKTEPYLGKDVSLITPDKPGVDSISHVLISQPTIESSEKTNSLTNINSKFWLGALASQVIAEDQSELSKIKLKSRIHKISRIHGLPILGNLGTNLTFFEILGKESAVGILGGMAVQVSAAIYYIEKTDFSIFKNDDVSRYVVSSLQNKAKRFAKKYPVIQRSLEISE